MFPPCSPLAAAPPSLPISSAPSSRSVRVILASVRLLMDLLILHRKTWNDLVDLLCSPTSPSWADATVSSPPPGFDANFLVIDLVHRLTEYYVALTPTLRVAGTLWILHTHVYDQFQITPRLALLSPVRG